MSSLHDMEHVDTEVFHLERQPAALPSNVVKECSLPYENFDVEDIYKQWNSLIPEEKWPVMEKIIYGLVEELEQRESLQENQQINEYLNRGGKGAIRRRNPADSSQELKPSKYYGVLLKPLMKKYKYHPRKAMVLYAYQSMLREGKVVRCKALEELLVTKSSKSDSGVLVITVVTSPYPTVNGRKQAFSCKWNCYYCPDQPGQPRSYLRDEPAVLRANQNGFDPVLQFTDRAATLAMNGHPVDKIELIVLGGTWASYPHDYQETFLRDLFYAANVFYSNRKNPISKREKLSLQQEQRLNETAECKIIGLTLETRPDTITPDEIRRLRRYGCTRVQLGLQHTCNSILEKINRKSTVEDAKKAISMLKQACFKVDVHLMPNLPGSSPELDNKMFDEMLNDEELQVDQWKIYPCEVTPWSVIKKWHEQGDYVPYEEEQLFQVIMRVKSKMHPWIRLNRVIRDIPTTYIFGGMSAPNLRQEIADRMMQENKYCRCIRCREIGSNRSASVLSDAVLKERTYKSSGGTEYFISYESADESCVFGFLRLRIQEIENPEDLVFPELHKTALIRELHVYGQLTKAKPIASDTGKVVDKHAQHVGFGKLMMKRAENIALAHGLGKIAVIAGVGTREYYRKLGYAMSEAQHQQGQYMMKIIGCETTTVANTFVHTVAVFQGGISRRNSHSKIIDFLTLPALSALFIPVVAIFAVARMRF